MNRQRCRNFHVIRLLPVLFGFYCLSADKYPGRKVLGNLIFACPVGECIGHIILESSLGAYSHHKQQVQTDSFCINNAKSDLIRRLPASNNFVCGAVEGGGFVCCGVYAPSLFNTSGLPFHIMASPHFPIASSYLRPSKRACYSVGSMTSKSSPTVSNGIILSRTQRDSVEELRHHSCKRLPDMAKAGQKRPTLPFSILTDSSL